MRLGRDGCSFQFGRASAPMMPHRVHTIRGPNVGTGTWSGHCFHVHDRPVVALPAGHDERAGTVFTHVAEGHRLYGFVGALLSPSPGRNVNRAITPNAHRSDRLVARRCDKAGCWGIRSEVLGQKNPSNVG